MEPILMVPRALDPCGPKWERNPLATRNGEPTSAAIDRRWPYQVALAASLC